MMGLTFINALVFGVQGNTLRALGKDTPLNQFLAGSAAGAIQCVICCPMELAKTRMQLQGTGEYKLKTKNYKNSLDCLIKIYQKEGLRGINRGMVSTFIRETPSFGFYYQGCLKLVDGAWMCKGRGSQTFSLCIWFCFWKGIFWQVKSDLAFFILLNRGYNWVECSNAI